MKKIALAIAALMMTSASILAQDNQSAPGSVPPQMDRTEMIQQMTQEMVSEYGLNEEQARQLLQLNTEYADKMPPMMMGPRGRFGNRPDSLRGGRNGRPQGGPRMDGQRPSRPDSARQGRQGRGQGGPRGQRPMMDRQQMQQQMEAYQQQLERIMTPDQFNKYKQDQQERMQRMMQRGGQRGQRPNRNN